jgi:glycosyltransferase involved in cell wall biosynthesis
MIYFDVTKTGSAAHRSGLTRVSSRLREELGRAVTPVVWDGRQRLFVREVDRRAVRPDQADWILTVELFSDAERPGFRDLVTAPPCRLAAVFHDAIPLRFPHITWPQSVQRHPDCLKLLAGFHRVWAVSESSRRDLLGFWRWQGVTPRATVGQIELGADFDGAPRLARGSADTAGRPAFVCVGIIEPRKNQGFLLEVAATLWRDGLDFDLHIAGRVNPHFGEPMVRRIRAAARREPRLHLHMTLSDAELHQLYGTARAVLFPTLAEGCGLPLLEALWRGVPCVGSDLPSLQENAAGGGCLLAAVNDAPAWREALRTLLTDASALRRLQQAAARRPLPKWAGAAQQLLDALG